MSGYVPEAEYQAIKASWRQPGAGLYALKNPEKWSNSQMAAACLVNIDDAAKLEAKLRREYSRLPPGDPRLVGDKDTPSMRERIRTAISDQKHWREQLTFWRGRCVAEGDKAVPPSKFIVDAGKQRRPSYIDDPKLNGDPIVAAERDRRLPREPGEDDES